MFNGFDGPEPSENFSWMEPDFVLSYLVSALVNLAGAPLGITLLVKGTILTGTLVSEREYLTILSDMLQSQIRRTLSGLSEEERTIAESAFDLTDLMEDFYPDLGADKDDEDDEDDDDFDNMVGINPIYHLHLKDPIILSPQPAITFSDGVFPVMRIRIANIDGWMMGASIPGMMGGAGRGDVRH
jgi:hypothetical protein